MNLTRDGGLESIVMDAMRQSLDVPREGIHLTDLLNPRYAYFHKVDPKPLTDDEVLYFLAGRGHEAAFGRLHGFEPGGGQTREGISYHADFYLTIPVEFKTRRRNLAKEGYEIKTYETYIDQVRGYAALHNRPAAWLWILSLLETQGDGSTKPEMRCYLLEFTEQELAEECKKLQERKTLLLDALIQHELERIHGFNTAHTTLPLCWAFKCGKLTKEVTALPRCTTCSREFQTDWGLGRHLASRPDHEVIYAEYASKYQPKCKWFMQCQPYKVDPERGG